MNETADVRMSFGAVPYPFSSNDVFPVVDLLSGIAQDEKIDRTVDSLISVENLRTLPSSTAGNGEPQKCITKDTALDKVFYSIALVLTVVEPYKEQSEYYQSECTGTFISRHVVLTLASCVKANDLFNADPEPSYTRVYTQEGFVKRTLKIHVYSNARNQRLYAALVLDTSIDKIDFEYPKLPREWLDFEQIKKSCTLAGFGDQTRLQVKNFQVRRLNDTVVSEVRCRSRDRLCLHFDNLQACRGDTGSPLICDGVVYALYSPRSFRPPHRCTDRFVRQFLPVAPARKWAESVGEPRALAWFSNEWYVLLTCLLVLGVISALYYLLAACVIRPFDRRVDVQLGVHMRSLESGESAGSHKRSSGYERKRTASVISDKPSALSVFSSRNVYSGKSPVGESRSKDAISTGSEKKRTRSFISVKSSATSGFSSVSAKRTVGKSRSKDDL